MVSFEKSNENDFIATTNTSTRYNSRLQEDNYSFETTQRHSGNSPINHHYYTDSIGDTIKIIKEEGTGAIKEYNCLRKAFVFFLISIKLNLSSIRATTTNTFFQFLYTYPTIVGWCFLATKIKRILFSMLNEEKKDSIVLDELIQEHHVDSISALSTNQSFYITKEDQLQVSNSYNNNTSIGHNSNHIQQKQMKNIDHQEKIISSVHFAHPNHSRYLYNDELKQGQKQDNDGTKRKCIEVQFSSSSWGHFVDCRTMDEEDETRDDLRLISQSISTSTSKSCTHNNNFNTTHHSESNDYGHFVDVGNDTISNN